MTWPPETGAPLPFASLAYGVHEKLAAYSLNPDHQDGGPKASVFQRILGITVADVDRLASALLDGLVLAPVRAVRDNPPHGMLCEVRIPVRGLGTQPDRVAVVITSWEVRHENDPPRLVTAYIRA